MVLVDTSVWIDFVRGRATDAVARLREGLDRGIGACLTSMIYQEILQGADSERALRDFCVFFSGQRFLHPVDPVTSHENAARLYFECRRKGLTIRSTNGKKKRPSNRRNSSRLFIGWQITTWRERRSNGLSNCHNGQHRFSASKLRTLMRS